MHKPKVGDRVAFKRSLSSRIDGLVWSKDFCDRVKFKGKDSYKGIITKIIYHKLFIFKRDKPLYIIDDYYITEDVKLILRG